MKGRGRFRRNVIITILFLGGCWFFLYILWMYGRLSSEIDNGVTKVIIPQEEHVENITAPIEKHPPPKEKPRETVVMSEAEKLRKLPFLSQFSTTIVVLTYKRANYLKKVLTSLFNLVGMDSIKNIVVSQDGHDKGVKDMVEMFQRNTDREILHWQKVHNEHNAFVAIANHYRFVMENAFQKKLKSDFVILVEDDLIPSRDFLHFFDQLAPMLVIPEEKVWCVSTWNDLGFKHFNLNASKVFRTQYFPGLGWMAHRSLWDELKTTFPHQGWDYFMRTSHVHRHRDCLCASLPRNTNIGKVGSSSGTKFDALLKNIDFFNGHAVKVDLDVESIMLRNYDSYLEEMLLDLNSPAIILKTNQKWSDTIIKKYSKQLETQAKTDRIKQEQLFQGRGAKHRNKNSKKKVFVIPYEYNKIEGIFRSMKITYHNEERTAHEHVIVIPYRKDVEIILVNVRLSRFANEKYRIPRKPNLEVVASKNKNENCDTTCKKAGNRRCDQSQFEYINNCDLLKEHFGCKKGCMIEIGKEIPCYVADAANRNHEMCIVVLQDRPQCSAKHKHTKRLCPCL